MTTQKNGNTATAPKENGKSVTPLTVVPTVTKEEAKTDIPGLKIAPLEERLNRLNELIELQKKYNRLQTSEHKLAEFKMKKGTENITLEIEDENIRERFTTSNPEVIEEVLETVRKTIQKRKKEIEPLLVW